MFFHFGKNACRFSILDYMLLDFLCRSKVGQCVFRAQLRLRIFYCLILGGSNKTELNGIELYDYELERKLPIEEFLADETDEEIEYYIDLKAHQIIEELRSNSPYQTVKDTILDSELFISEDFYNQLLFHKMEKSEYLKEMIFKREETKLNEKRL